MPLSDFYPELKGWKPAENPPESKPQIPTVEVQQSPYLRTVLPLPMQYAPDTLKQYNKPGLSSFRIAPLAPNAVPAINSAAQSTATSIANTAASSSAPDATNELTWRGQWLSFANYQINDVVLFNISAYVATTTSNNLEPDANPTNWTLLGKNLNPRGQFVQLGTTDVAHIAFVQSSTGTTGGAATTATFGSNNTAGNTILVMAAADFSFISGTVDPSYVFSVTDLQNNVYTPLGGHTYSNNHNLTTDQQVFIAKNVKGGPNTVTLKVSGGGAAVPTRFSYMNVGEYSGNVNVNPLINSASSVNPGSGSVSVTLATTQVNQMAVLFGVMSPSGPPAGFSGHGSSIGPYYDGIISTAKVASYTVSDNTSNQGLSLWGIVLTDTAASVSYVPFDVVEYLGSTYLCVQSTNVDPVTAGTNYWLQLSQGTGGINNLTANYTAVSGDYGKLLTNTSASNYTVTLPSPPPLAAWWIALQNSGTGTIVINPNGLTLDGSSSSLTLAQNQGVLIFTDGTNYFTERGFGTITSLPSIFNVSSTGAATIANEAANTVWAGPSSGGAGPATFRALVTADLSAGILSFNRKVISATSYTTLSSDVGKALDVQTSSATTVTLQVGAPTPAFVRSYGFNRLTGAQTTGTLGGVTLTAGHLAVITVEWYNNTSGTVTDTITVADSNGNTWNKVPNTFIINTAVNGGLSATGAGQQLWYSNITVGGAGVTITATFPSTVQYPALYGAEGSGVTQVDNSAAAQGNGTPSSGNITTVASSTFVYGSVYDDGGGSSAAGTGWTLLQTTFNQYLNEYRLPVATGTFTATSNFAGTHLYTSAIASFSSPVTTPFSGFIQNNGSAIVAVTPSSGLINGSASINLFPGQGATIATDGTNFTAILWDPSVVAKVDLTAQGAAITATTLYAVPTGKAGMYRVSWSTKVTQAATTSSTLAGTNGFQVTYTDADDSVVVTPLAKPNAAATGNTTGTQLSGVEIVNAKAGTNIQYKIDYTSSGATPMQYNLHIKAEYLG